MKFCFPSIFIVFFLFSQFLLASEIKLKLYDSEIKKIKEVGVVVIENKKVTKNCVKGGRPKCLAWEALSREKIVIKKNIRLIGHPAARLCDQIGATNLLLLDSKGIEFDYCFFKDNTAVNSWDLYNAIQ